VKIFFKIFLLYFFSLVLLSCNEAEAGVQQQELVSINVSATNNKTSHQHQDEYPPLCSCICCNHVVVKAFELVVPVKHVFLQWDFSSYYRASTANMHYPIWQPPQLD
jgi:hypothetical protein